MDMTECIAPRSDQMNAEDLLTGPRTFTIATVRKGASAEQPVDVVLAEFHDDRPFKPSKTVRRLMVAAWGADTASYVGKRMTLYRDPAVRFGGQDVGGIRVSHMSGIDKPLTIALTVTRGKRAPYRVQPLTEAVTAETPEDRAVELRAEWKTATPSRRKAIEAEVERLTAQRGPQPAHEPSGLDEFHEATTQNPTGPAPSITRQQQAALMASFNEAGITDRTDRLLFCTDATGRTIDTTNALTRDEAKVCLDLVKNPGYVEKWRDGGQGDGTLPVGE